MFDNPMPKSQETGAEVSYNMDETHENETSAKKQNSKIQKLMIMTSLSDLITEIENNSFLTSMNVVEQLVAIIKMLTIETGDMNNNKEVDVTEVANIQAKGGNLCAPEMVELLNSPAAVNASPLGNDDGPQDLSKHHSTSSAVSSSSRSSSSSETSSEMTSHSDDVLLIGDDVADSVFLTKTDLQCPECGQQVPGPRHGALQNTDDQLFSCFPQRPEIYTLTWLEDTESGLYWCEEETELDTLCHSPAPSHKADTAHVNSQVYEEIQNSKVFHDVILKEVCNDVNERKCETVEKEEFQNVPRSSRKKIKKIKPLGPRLVAAIDKITQSLDPLTVENKVHVSEVCRDTYTQECSQQPKEQSLHILIPEVVWNDVNEQKCETVEKKESRNVSTQSLDPCLVGTGGVSTQSLDPCLVGTGGSSKQPCSASADRSFLSHKNIFLKSDQFFRNVSNAITSVAPNFIFDKARSDKRGKRKRAKEAARVVPDEFKTLWKAVREEEDVIITPSPYPTVDWSKVNSRFIQNIPKPTRFPIHSCSQDPEFYGGSDWLHRHPCPFTGADPAPFGSISGYDTSEGIIPVPTVPFHGYVYKQNRGWILHSELPSKSTIEDGGRREEQRRRGQRGGRRGDGRRGRERGKRG